MIVAIAVRFWTMGLQASILIGVVLAVRFFLKKYPKIYSYALWALVGVRLLCPFWVESSFSLLPNLLSKYSAGAYICAAGFFVARVSGYQEGTNGGFFRR